MLLFHMRRPFLRWKLLVTIPSHLWGHKKITSMVPARLPDYQTADVMLIPDQCLASGRTIGCPALVHRRTSNCTNLVSYSTLSSLKLDEATYSDLDILVSQDCIDCGYVLIARISDDGAAAAIWRCPLSTCCLTTNTRFV